MADQFGNNHMYLLSFRKSLMYIRIALKSLCIYNGPELMIFLFFQGAGLTGGHHHTLVVPTLGIKPRALCMLSKLLTH